MKMTDTLYAATRQEWREWLEKNHATAPEIWLIYYKKGSDRPRVPYDDAVEEALCFGWIDSTVQKIDEEKYAQRFSPRRNGSGWSDLNKRRVRQLIDRGLMTEAGLAKVTFDLARQEDPPRPRSIPELPAEIEQALRESEMAWERFSRLPPSERRNFTLWLSSARREETRRKRIAEAIELLERNERLGMR